MIRIELDDATRRELQALRRRDLPAPVRDRLEMVLLSAAGWSAPRIAAYLTYCAQTVRSLLRDFRRRGQQALFPRRPGPAPDPERRQRLLDRLRELLAQDRTRTSRQLSEAFESHGIRIGSRQVRRYLARLRAGGRGTNARTRPRGPRPS